MCMCMRAKTISIMNDAYNILKNKKRKNESFSGVIRRLAGSKKDIMEFAGIWKNIAEEDTEKMKENILELRRRSTAELMKNLKRR